MDFNAKEESATSQWRVWKQLWEAYSVVNHLADKGKEYQAGVVIGCLGQNGVHLLDTLPFAREEDRKDASEILQLLDEHFVGEENVAYERFQFYQRVQKHNETIEEFIGALRVLARTCRFVENSVNFSSQMIRDRIICGIHDEGLREKLISKGEIALEKCVKICRATAIKARQRCSGVNSNSEDARVCAVAERVGRRKSQERSFTLHGPVNSECRFCGRRHAQGKCPAWGKKCNRCGRVNHFAIRCRAVSAAQPLGSRHASVHAVDDNGDETSEILTVTVESILAAESGRDRRDRIVSKMMVCGQVIPFQIDTGATCNLLRKTDVPKGVRIDPFAKTLRFYNGTKEKSLGECEMEVFNPRTGRSSIQHFIVVENGVMPILGLRAAEEMNLIKIETENIYAIEESTSNTPTYVPKTTADFEQDFQRCFVRR